MRTVAIIPARMGATRFPGKPMEKILGVPMIGHVYYRTSMANGVDLTCVATCDRVIFDYINGIGGYAVMTSDLHDRASDRAAEALVTIESQKETIFDIVAMIQGDEPLLNPNDFYQAIIHLKEDPGINVVNLMGIIKNKEDFLDKNIVKVVTNIKNEALYFSREPIPYECHKVNGAYVHYQTGLIFFRHDYLLKFNSMDQTPLEIIESIDMMRILENSERVKMVTIAGENFGVDTEQDMAIVRGLMAKDLLFKKYNNRS